MWFVQNTIDYQKLTFAKSQSFSSDYVKFICISQG